MLIPDGYAQVNLHWTWTATAQVAEVAFGVALDDIALTPASVAAFVFSAYDSAGLDQVNTPAITLDNIHVKFGPNETGAAADAPQASPGVLTGNSVTPNVTLLIRKNTLHGGHRGRGRMYWPGIQEGVVDDYGQVDSGAVTTFQSKFDDFLTALIATNTPMYVLHAAPTTEHPEEPPAPFAVDNLQVMSTVATQRRRLR